MKPSFINTKYLAPVCAGAGLLCVAGTVWAAMGLTLGTPFQRLMVAGALLGIAALAMLLLHFEGVSRKGLLILFLPVGAAMLLRGLCMAYTSSDYIFFLSKWVAHFREHGGFGAIAEKIGDYNVPYLYFLAAISYLRFPDMYLIKLLSVLADVGLAWGGLRLARILRGERHGDKVPMMIFGLLLLLPTVVLNGAYWGQCDAIYGALVLHALAMVLEGRNSASVALLAVAFSFKLQTVFLIPLWGVMWLAGRVKFRELLVFPAAYFATILPAMLLGKPLGDILGVYFNQMGEYARLTLNAPSIYQFIPRNMTVNEALLSAVGVGMAFALVVVLFFLGLWQRKRLDNAIAVTMAMVLAVGVPFFLPHMHERYFFLADVVTLCWACVAWRRIPAAVLVCGASCASYLVYLNHRDNCAFMLWGWSFSMALEALAMLVALIIGGAVLTRQIRKKGLDKQENLC